MNLHYHVLALVGLACLAACGEDTSTAPSETTDMLLPSIDVALDDDMDRPEPDIGNQFVDSCEATWLIEATSLVLECGDNRLVFNPEVRINGNWMEPSTCTSADDTDMSCRVEGFGELTLAREGSIWRMLFQADNTLIFDGFRFRGMGRLDGIESWLSNGFQSWSQSGLIQIGPRFTDVATNTALSAQGDLEVVRGGKELSWWLSYAVGPTNLIAGGLTARNFKTWIQLNQEDNRFYCTITSGQTDDNISLEIGETIASEALWISLNPDLNEGLNDYASALPSRVPRRAVAETGWNSWYELWDDITATDIIENARLVPGILDAITFEEQRPYRIVVDDGWQIGWGEWRANDGFQGGVQQIATQLQTENFKPGIWIAPLLVSEGADIVSEHPEWFLPEAAFTHLAHGKMRILDVTHPEAAAKLRNDIQHLVTAGFGLLKIDFLFAGTYTSPRYEAMPAMRAYERAVSIIRDAAGPETILLAVGAPPSLALTKLTAGDSVQILPCSSLMPRGTSCKVQRVHPRLDGPSACIRSATVILRCCAHSPVKKSKRPRGLPH